MNAIRQTEKTRPSRRTRILRIAVVVLALVGLSWLAAWLGQRSLRVPAKKRAMQSWLDENLNADVSLLGDMSVRLNLIRESRLFFSNVEVEHPNPLFPGKFVTVNRMGAWIPPWSLARLMAGEVEFLFQGLRMNLAENEAGEWSTDGLMRPLITSDVAFPFPVPKISRWKARVRDGRLSIVRQGYELDLNVDAELFGRPGNDRISIVAGKIPLTFGPVDAAERQAGSIEPVTLRVAQRNAWDRLPAPVAGECEFRVDSLPAAILPFLAPGIPLSQASGLFSGLIRLDKNEDAAGTAFLEGELRDAPLTVFGLPRNAPLRLSWPLSPKRDGLTAEVHMGPSGFGAFTLNIPLNREGEPTRLRMRGDVAALDDIPRYFTMHSVWPDWLSRTFPAIEWQSGEWRGFGWTGANMLLSLVRTTAGLNLTGEAEMLGGRVRVAMTPDQRGAPIIVAAEKLNASRMAARLCQNFPEPFKVQLDGAHTNLTWRGFPTEDGALEKWSSGMVFAKPVVDLAASGSWWRSLHEIARAIIGELPRWGGGDPEFLIKFTGDNTLSFDQLSLVIEREADGYTAVEFRAYGEAVGQITGVIERREDGAVEGEFLLSGASVLLEAVERANPRYAWALGMLANDTPGLRVIFRAEADGEPVFAFPFIADAGVIREELERSGSGFEWEKGDEEER